MNDVSSEDISEEAICRICFVELSEGGETLKMECSCRGELAYAHRECAITWFRTKGDNKCEVCQEEVRNLPVTLLTVHNPRNVPEVNNNVAEVNNNAAEANKCRQVEWDQHYLAAFDEFAGYLTYPISFLNTNYLMNLIDFLIRRCCISFQIKPKFLADLLSSCIH